MTAFSFDWFAADLCPVAAVDPGWFTQPVATVLAAGIAVLAAGIAYAGVLRTTSTTRRENRRAEKVEVLTMAHIAIQDYMRAISQIGSTNGPDRIPLILTLNEGKIDEINQAVSLAYGKLYLYGFRDVSRLAAASIAQMRLVWVTVCNDPTVEVPMEPIDETYKACLKALTDAFDHLK